MKITQSNALKFFLIFITVLLIIIFIIDEKLKANFSDQFEKELIEKTLPYGDF